MLHCAGKIDNGQQKEHKSLYKGDKYTQRHDGQRREKCPGKSEQDGQNDLMAHHVSKKTEREGQNPCSMADEFNDKDQRAHPPDRPQKMLDVFDAMVFQTDDVGKHDNDNGA